LRTADGVCSSLLRFGAATLAAASQTGATDKSADFAHISAVTFRPIARDYLCLSTSTLLMLRRSRLQRKQLCRPTTYRRAVTSSTVECRLSLLCVGTDKKHRRAKVHTAHNHYHLSVAKPCFVAPTPTVSRHLRTVLIIMLKRYSFLLLRHHGVILSAFLTREP